MTTTWLVSPWRRALRAERCLPSGVMGPVEYCELRRLISARSSCVVDIGIILGLRVMGDGELGVGSDVEVIDWVGVRICLGDVIGAIFVKNTINVRLSRV